MPENPSKYMEKNWSNPGISLSTYMYRISICDDLHHIINIYIYIHTYHDLFIISFPYYPLVNYNFTMENHHAFDWENGPTLSTGPSAALVNPRHKSPHPPPTPCHRRHRWSADNMRIPASHEAEKTSVKPGHLLVHLGP